MKKYLLHSLMILMIMAGICIGISMNGLEPANAATGGDGIKINDTVTYGDHVFIVVSEKTLGSGNDKSYLVLLKNTIHMDPQLEFGYSAEWNESHAKVYLNGGSYDLPGGENRTEKGWVNKLKDVDLVAQKVKIKNSETETEKYTKGGRTFIYKKSRLEAAALGDTAFFLSPGEWLSYRDAVGEKHAVTTQKSFWTRSWSKSWDQGSWVYANLAGMIHGSEGLSASEKAGDIGDAYSDWTFQCAYRPAMYLKAKYFVENETKKTNWIIETSTATITFNTGGGSEVKSITQLVGSKLKKPADPVRKGYTFVKWQPKFPEVMPAKSVTLKAIWKKIPAPGGLLLAKMTAKGSKAMNISWTKVNGADGYDVYLSKCNEGKKTHNPRLIKSVKGNTVKVIKKGLRGKTSYKALVKAYVKKDGQKKYVATSPEVHAFTSGGNGLFTNPKSVTVKTASVSLKKNGTYKIKAKVKKVKTSKLLISKMHAPKLRYVSTNKKIAKVNSAGKITAVSPGACKVYVFAANGVRAAVKVTVK